MAPGLAVLFFTKGIPRSESHINRCMKYVKLPADAPAGMREWKTVRKRNWKRWMWLLIDREISKNKKLAIPDTTAIL